MQGTRIQFLICEDSTCRGEAKARVPQLLKPVCPGACTAAGEKPLLTTTKESPSRATKTQHSQSKINILVNQLIIIKERQTKVRTGP